MCFQMGSRFPLTGEEEPGPPIVLGTGEVWAAPRPALAVSPSLSILGPLCSPQPPKVGHATRFTRTVPRACVSSRAGGHSMCTHERSGETDEGERAWPRCPASCRSLWVRGQPPPLSPRPSVSLSIKWASCWPALPWVVPELCPQGGQDAPVC